MPRFLLLFKIKFKNCPFSQEAPAASFFLALIFILIPWPTLHADEFKSLTKAPLAEWKSLLQFSPGLFGDETLAQNQDFYLGDRKKTSAMLEFNLGLAALNKNENGDQAFQCRFPARALFLKKYGHYSGNLDFSSCKALQHFKWRIDLDAVSLVFASYFVDNPGSAFGHTFLRLKKKNQQSAAPLDLLDYGVNYAAFVTTKNPVLYGIYGIFGGFTGNYTMMPYFFKIREYNDMESRQLFEYGLKLSAQEKENFLFILWELDKAVFTYYYLRENCSFQVLKILNLLRPEQKFISNLGYFVVPIDTLIVLKEDPTLLGPMHFRPSQSDKIKATLALSTNAEKTSYQKMLSLIRGKTLEDGALSAELATYDNEGKGRILDALIDQTDYLYSAEILMGQGEALDRAHILKMKMSLLKMRSGLSGIKPQLANIPLPSHPLEGHASRRMTLGLQTKTNHDDPLVNFSYRFALHDPLDFPSGHNQDTQLEMGNFKIQYDNKNHHLNLNDARIVSVVARRRFDLAEAKLSWPLAFGVMDLPDTRKIEWATYLKLGIGPTFYFTAKDWLSIFLVANTYRTSSWRLDVGPEIQTLYRFNDHWALYLNAHHLKILQGTLTHSPDLWSDQIKLTSQYSFKKDLGLRPWIARSKGPQTYTEIGLDLMGYFY